MRKLKIFGVSVILHTLSFSALGDGLAFRFSGDSIGASYTTGVNSGRSSLQLRYLRNGDDDFDIGSLGLFVNGQRGEILGRVGVKANYVDLDGLDGTALSFGGDAALGGEFGRFVISGFIGPSAASSGDIDGMSEWSAGFEFPLLDNAAVELGYGEIQVDTDVRSNIDLDDGAYVRLKMQF